MFRTWKKALNRAVLLTANLSKVVKRTRGKRGRKKRVMRKEMEKKERRRRRKMESGGRGRSVRKEPDSWRDGGREGQKLENE